LGLLNISVRGEYALLAMLDLSLQKEGEPVKIAAIAQRRGIPQKFLELILASLKQGGFVASRRGADGGYMLARPAESILVGEVLLFVERGRGGGKSAQGPESPFSDLWREVDSAVESALGRRSFADVARAWAERQSAYVPNWDI
jgi:Rrf2 family protein